VSVLLVLLARLFVAVTELSCEASILVLAVLAVRSLLGRKLPPRWRHALWCVVLLRLVMPALPASPFSIYRMTPPGVFGAVATQPARGGTAAFGRAPAIHFTSGARGWLVAGVQLGAVVWLAGVIGFGAAMAGANGRFGRRLRALRREGKIGLPCCADAASSVETGMSSAVLPEEKLAWLAWACAGELGVRRRFAIIETGLVESPAIFGLWRPTLLLPTGLAARLSDTELRLVLLHELAHLRRADLYHHALLSVLQVVHWFNPFLGFAFRRMRDDRELAADALVLSGPRATLRTKYGHTLLKLIEGTPAHASAVLGVGILEDPRQLRNRLERIRQATPENYGWSRLGVSVTCLLGAMFLTRTYGEARTMVIEAKVADQPWNGWGFSPPADESATVSGVEEFSLAPDAPVPRTFSGRVVADGSLAGVEVGLVSLVGVHWVNPAAYQWQAVRPDGTFSITDERYLDAPKALTVRGPNLPWTFLRYNFSSRQSATGIVLRAAPARTIQLSASGPDGRDLTGSSFELFPAHAEYDDQGRVLRRQRLGEFESGAATSARVVAPEGEVAVFAHCAGYASYYQVIDTRHAEQFRFVLQAAGGMRISVVDQDGRPERGVSVRWVNPAAPLSISGSATDDSGRLRQGGLTPGNFVLNVTGFAPREVTISANQETEINFRAGIDP
jgi:beta-lactamase regulating signal transducer with metallopeptidase domain